MWPWFSRINRQLNAQWIYQTYQHPVTQPYWTFTTSSTQNNHGFTANLSCQANHVKCNANQQTVLLLRPYQVCRTELASISFWSRSSLIVYHHVWSKTTLIAIIAKLEIIYTAWPHNGVLSILSLQLQSIYMYSPINTAQGEQEDGEWESQLQQPAITNW